MNWSIEEWKFAFVIINAIATAGISVAMWILSRYKANASRIDLLEQKHSEEAGELRTRLTKIETTLKHMPNKESIGNIHKRLDDQGRTLHTMEGQLKGLNDSTAMILQALITKKDDNK